MRASFQIRIHLLFTVAVCWTYPAAGAVDNLSRIRNQEFDWGTPTGGPLCGIYSAARAAALLGRSVDVREGISVDTISSASGSTPDDIVRFLSRIGLGGTPMHQLTINDVTWSDCPMILNVRPSFTSSRYSHWVTVANHQSGLVLYDGTKKPVPITAAEIAGIWSGVGIAVHEPGDRQYFKSILRRGLSFGLVLFGMTIAYLLWHSWGRIYSKSKSRSPPGHIQACRILLTSIFLCGLSLCVFADITRLMPMVRIATASAVTPSLKTATLAELQQLAMRQDVLLVDARYPSDFQNQTISGAVNIPVSANHRQIELFLDGIDRAVPLVVFCHSSSCGFDEAVANQLAVLGFSNLTVCSVGWVEYSVSTQSIRDSPQ